jgi:hypothetical protein
VDEPEAPQTHLNAHRYHSFVVRVLTKTSADAIVHGEVTNVATRHQLRFTDLRSVLPFIRAQLGLPNKSEARPTPLTPDEDS